MGGTLAAVVAPSLRAERPPAGISGAGVLPLTDSSFGGGPVLARIRRRPVDPAVASGVGPADVYAQQGRLAESRRLPVIRHRLARPTAGTGHHGRNRSLRDEGEAYAEALQRAGVSVAISRYPGMIHGFAQMAGVIDAARKAIEELATALRQAFER